MPREFGPSLRAIMKRVDLAAGGVTLAAGQVSVVIASYHIADKHFSDRSVL
jgi:hypothetical protein